MAPAYLTIGQLAQASGLSAKALRHYDRLGVLRPATIDPDTGYRCYAPSQTEQARRIRALRKLKVPLRDIAAILDDPASEAARRSLLSHRDRVGAQLAELQSAFYFLGELIDGKDIDHAMPRRPDSVQIDAGEQRRLGAELFNYVWTLLEKPDRTAREDDRMIDAAHASRFFWESIGDPVNHARGEWQISRAYASVGRGEAASHHAQRCLELCEAAQIDGFDLGYAYEALARASALEGESDAAADYVARAHQIAAGVTPKADRELLLSDLASLRQLTQG